ncbi:WD40-repeat-containing domain protein [Suillus variegatus]|nr:WD40-repeat-containing domain protein [Suillus variegatus]
MSSAMVRRKEASAIKPCQTFEGHTHLVYGAIHLPGGERIMTCSIDGSLRVWNLKSGKQIGDDWQDGDSQVRTIVLSPDEKKVVSGSEDGRVRLWDIDTGKYYWARNRFSGRQGGEDIELHERPSAVVDVPYAKGKRRNACAREKQMKIIPLKPGNPAASTSRPPNNNAAQHSSGATQAQAQAAASTSTAPPVANTTSHPNLDPTIKTAGRWTRFWLFFCCASPEYTHSHHG